MFPLCNLQSFRHQNSARRTADRHIHLLSKSNIPKDSFVAKTLSVSRRVGISVTFLPDERRTGLRRQC